MRKMETKPISSHGSTRPLRTAGPAIKKRSSRVKWILLIGLLVLVLLPAFLLAGLYIYMDTNGLVFPGVMIGETDVSWMTLDQVMTTIDQAWNQKKLMVTDGARQWLAAPIDFGIWVDPSTTAEKAFQVGHNERWLHELLFVLSGQTIVIQPVTSFDTTKARTLMDMWASQVSVPPRNARLELQNGQWVMLPGQNGSYLDVDATLKQMYANPIQLLTNGFIPLTIRAVAPRINDVSRAETTLKSLLGNPLILRAHRADADENLDWTVPQEVLVTWLSFDEQHGVLSVKVDQDTLNSYLSAQETTLGGGVKLEHVKVLESVAKAWQANEPFVVEVISG